MVSWLRSEGITTVAMESTGIYWLNLYLGASSISDSWTASAQNEKTTKEYLRRVREESLPLIIKNHFLTEEDQRIRRQILDLICHYQVNWFSDKTGFIPT